MEAAAVVVHGRRVKAPERVVAGPDPLVAAPLVAKGTRRRVLTPAVVSLAPGAAAPSDLEEVGRVAKGNRAEWMPRLREEIPAALSSSS